jgi:hypothetical protein
MKDPKYKNFLDEDEDYVSEDLDSLKPGFDDLDKETKERIVRETVTKRTAMPRMEEEKIKPLERKTPEILGNLFDRVEFLGQRISENHEAMETRKALHDEITQDVDVDIEEKKNMVGMITDVEEKRNFKMDISILRKEKRTESINFWRDMTELRSELRELLEQYETEKRIKDMFHGLGGKI